MNTKIYIFAFFAVFLCAIVSLGGLGNTPRALAWTCDGGIDLDSIQAVQAYAAGDISIQFSPDLSASTQTATVVNNTSCPLPVSLATYKMFVPFDPGTVSTQVFFSGTAITTVAASSTGTLLTSIPPCASQYDVWYGDSPQALLDNHDYYLQYLAGGFIRPDDLCTTGSTNTTTTSTTTTTTGTTTPTSALHVIKHVINDNGGTATSSDFSLRVTLAGIDIAGSPFSGTDSPGNSFSLAAGTYTVSETASSSYASSFSGDCDSSGVIVLSSADATCTITNNDVSTAPGVPNTGGGGGTTPPSGPGGGGGGVFCGAGGCSGGGIAPISGGSSGGGSGGGPGISSGGIGGGQYVLPSAGIGPFGSDFDASSLLYMLEVGFPLLLILGYLIMKNPWTLHDTSQ